MNHHTQAERAESVDRVAHVSPHAFLPRTGGITSHILNLAKGMQEIEHTVLTVGLPGLPSEEQLTDNLRVVRFGPVDTATIRSSSRLRHLYPTLPRPIHLASAVGELIRMRRMARFLKQQHFDILHLHEIGTRLALRGANKIRAVALKRWLLDRAAIIDVELPRVFTDHSHLSRTPADEDWVHHEIDFDFAALADQVICVERAGRRNFEEYLDATASRPEITYIPNCVDTDLFAFQPLPRRDELVVGFVGRMEGVRGIPLLTETINRAPAGVRFEIAIGHFVPSVLHQFLDSLTSRASYNIEKELRPQDIPAFLAGIDILFNPVMIEGISLASLEALAVGRPVIMLDKGDRYPTVSGRTGYLVPNNVEAVTALLRRLRNMRDELAEYGRRGRQIVEKEFSLATCCPRIRSVYEKAVRKSGRAFNQDRNDGR